MDDDTPDPEAEAARVARLERMAEVARSIVESGASDPLHLWWAQQFLNNRRFNDATT